MAYCHVELLQDGCPMLEIVYEDNHLLVVVKPPNLLTQGDKTGDVCLLDLAKADIKQRYQKPGEAYVGLVHRLDRPVGGLVVLAKTSKEASRLSEQLKKHTMGREYLAVVCNAYTLKDSTLVNYLLKDEKQGTVSVVNKNTNKAQEARLSYTILQKDPLTDTALIKVTLESGRKHQIRIQMANSGHPLLYDMRYGKGEKGKSIGLWGAILKLTHPTTKQELTFTSMPKGDAFLPFSQTITLFLSQLKPN